MLYLNGNSLTPHITKFPDCTSQLWNIPESFFHGYYNRIMWCYESDNELMVLRQLCCLLDNYSDDLEVELFISYLPYARQDRPVGNTVCFALTPFAQFLNEMGFDKILILDPHSDTVFTLIKNSYAIYPYQILGQIIEIFKQDIICYPDNGAALKYKQIYGDRYGLPIIEAKKERDAQTGKISNVKIISDDNELQGKSILIIDDICDGGNTFIQLSHALKNRGVESVDLFVTHGLFTQGKAILHMAGLRNIWAADRLMGLREELKFNEREDNV